MYEPRRVFVMPSTVSTDVKRIFVPVASGLTSIAGSYNFYLLNTNSWTLTLPMQPHER